MVLYTNISILYGGLKERENKECVSPSAIASWERSIAATEEICIEGLKQIKAICEAQNKELTTEAEKWRGSYFWLKDQNEQEEIKIEVEEQD